MGWYFFYSHSLILKLFKQAHTSLLYENTDRKHSANTTSHRKQTNKFTDKKPYTQRAWEEEKFLKKFSVSKVEILRGFLPLPFSLLLSSQEQISSVTYSLARSTYSFRAFNFQFCPWLALLRGTVPLIANGS